MSINKIIIELRCKNCKQFFLYHRKSGNDFRCHDCKRGMTAEEVEKELAEMDREEYESFMQDIREYEEKIKNKGKV